MQMPVADIALANVEDISSDNPDSPRMVHTNGIAMSPPLVLLLFVPGVCWLGLQVQSKEADVQLLKHLHQTDSKAHDIGATGLAANKDPLVLLESALCQPCPCCSRCPRCRSRSGDQLHHGLRQLHHGLRQLHPGLRHLRHLHLQRHHQQRLLSALPSSVWVAIASAPPRPGAGLMGRCKLLLIIVVGMVATSSLAAILFTNDSVDNDSCPKIVLNFTVSWGIVYGSTQRARHYRRTIRGQLYRGHRAGVDARGWAGG
jgi:hypothetical protein